jgi:hypothetical protein
VDPFLAWIQSVSMASWDLEKEISGEEKEKVMGCWLMQLARMHLLFYYRIMPVTEKNYQ